MRVFLLICLCCVFGAAAQAGVNNQLRQGGKQYNAKKYGSALNTYNEILRQNPNDPRALFNAGNAYYRLQEYTQAQDMYQEAAKQPDEYAQNALYNLANAYYQAGNKEKAIETYKTAIVKNPQDKDAVHNLQLIIQQQQNQQNQNQQNEDNQNNDSDQQNQDKQDENKGRTPQQQQPQPKNGQMEKKDADRVMAMAKEQEYHRGTPQSQADSQAVEKDW